MLAERLKVCRSAGGVEAQGLGRGMGQEHEFLRERCIFVKFHLEEGREVERVGSEDGEARINGGNDDVNGPGNGRRAYERERKKASKTNRVNTKSGRQLERRIKSV